MSGAKLSRVRGYNVKRTPHPPSLCSGPLSHKGRGEESHAAIFTYSKSPGLLSMPTLGGAIQFANLPGSETGSISEEMKSPSEAEGR